jgi:hypothetical protein
VALRKATPEDIEHVFSSGGVPKDASNGARMIASVSPAFMLGGLPNITALRILKVWVLLKTEECPPLL